MTTEQRIAILCARIERFQPLEPGLVRDIWLKTAYAELDFIKRHHFGGSPQDSLSNGEAKNG